MNKTEKVFVKVLDNYINGRSCKDMDFSGLDIERFKELVRIHKVVGIFYSCLKETNVDKDTLQYFELGFYSQLALFQKRSMVKGILKELFDNNNIDHIWIKGSQVADLYPNPEFRSMSDFDVVIEEKNREKSHRLLTEAGALYNREGSEATVRVYKLHGINLEIHTSLVSDKLWMNGVDFSGYFSDVFAHKLHTEGCSYILDKEYNIIYNLFHIAKHFYGSGCGIRMLLDLPVLVRNYEDILWKKIWSELDKIKLSGFAGRLFKVSEEWFGEYGILYNEKYIIDNMELIENYIIDGGIYGFEGRNTEAVQIKHHGSNKKGGYSYLMGMIHWAFPSYKEMRQCSLWFHDKPAVLLPVAYIERFLRNAKERGGVLKWGRKIISGKKELKEKNDILSVMDLK